MSSSAAVANTTSPGRPQSWAEAEQLLIERRRNALAMGGEASIQKQRDKGRLTPRERVDLLFDQGSFQELGKLALGTLIVPGRPDRPTPADGIVVGWGDVVGRRVCVIADDGTIAAGARGPAANRKAAAISAFARNSRLPLVWFAESSVNRMQHVMGAQFAGDLERELGALPPLRFTRSGLRAPTVIAISGQSVGRPSFAAMVSEFVTLTSGSSSMALAGPSIVRAAIGDPVTSDELGGAEMHAKTTGLVDYVGDSEAESIDGIRRFLDYLPPYTGSAPRRVPGDDPGERLCPELYDIVPLAYRRAYDMRKVVRAIADAGEVLEIKASFARNLVTALARLDGWTVGIVGNNPLYSAGIVDPPAIQKLVRFVQLCNLYNIPIVILQDQPGVMVGPGVERQQIVKNVVWLSQTMRSVTTPVLTVLVRKCYGFSYLLLGARMNGGDTVVAWPSASISLAGPEAGVATVLAAEERAGTLTDERRAEVLAHYLEDARARHAAYAGRLDDIIEPEQTRAFLARQLALIGIRGAGVRYSPKPALRQ